MLILLNAPQRVVSHVAGLALQQAGHRIERRQRLDAAVAAVGNLHFDAAVLHAESEGEAWLTQLRAARPDLPMLVITEREEPSERALWLRRGAEDCVSAPFDIEELEARVSRLLRVRADHGDRLQVGDLTLDPHAMRVTRDGKRIDLSALELRLLRHLMEQTGRIQTRAQLIHTVWGLRNDPGTNVVEVYISYLRAKVDKGFDAPLIHTVRGLGYVLEPRPSAGARCQVARSAS